MRFRLAALVVALGSSLTAVAADARPAMAGTVVVAQYSFDGRTGVLLDNSGRGHTMHLVTRHGGTVRPVRRGAGRGLQFPARCSGRKCPHAVLRSRHAADLNPGTRPLDFGATVRLAPSQTSRGQNVVQKGLAASSSQYKLQVDGRAGRPSCVLVGVGERRIRRVLSTVTVADGAWHVVRCRRLGPNFTILIDGVTRGLVRIPGTLSVANRHPLSVGGKGGYADNDQFHGALDDIFIRIG